MKIEAIFVRNKFLAQSMKALCVYGLPLVSGVLVTINIFDDVFLPRERRLLPNMGAAVIAGILSILISDLERPSFRLHPLKGDLKGVWSVTIRANWRITFAFEDECATHIDLVDYH